jgi:hypothetical protein
MSVRQALVLRTVISSWVVGCLAMTAARGQVQALPPTTTIDRPSRTAWVDRPVSYDVVQNEFPGPTVDIGEHFAEPRFPYPHEYWHWQMLPEGLLYRAYMAGGRESRFASHWFHEKDQELLWDIALGGQVGMLRYGNCDAYWPEGWQLDIEGAAFPRLTLNSYRELVSCDFRFGIPLTFRRGPLETKFAYYHLSSHLGDEYMVRYATLGRINYTRDVFVAAVALRPIPDLRLYAEAGWAFHDNGGSKPWEFQFGIDYSPIERWSLLGTPFFAINTRIRQEVDYGGNLTVQTGLQWRSRIGSLFRAGVYYFNGKTDQYQFFREHEEQIGFGLWYDF